MWEQTCVIMPVLVLCVASGERKYLKKNLETLPWKYSIDSLQRRDVLGTSHIIRKVLSLEI